MIGALLRGDCPGCEQPGLFAGPVAFAPRCRACGMDYGALNVGDGPAAILILVVGALVVIGALVIELRFSPPWPVHLVWLPVTAGLTLLGLRFAKAWLARAEYRHQAREGRRIDR